MSETTTTMKRLEMVREEYNRLLRRYEGKLDRLTLKMNEDYEYFFRWHSAEMYKHTVNLRSLRTLKPLFYEKSEDEVKAALQRHIGNIESELIEGCQLPSSTSLMMNAADSISREAKQELRNEFMNLLWILEEQA